MSKEIKPFRTEVNKLEHEAHEAISNLCNQPPKPTFDTGAMARLKELTAYMSDEQREKLVREGRSETYETYMRGKREAYGDPLFIELVNAADDMREYITQYVGGSYEETRYLKAVGAIKALFEKLSGGV